MPWLMAVQRAVPHTHSPARLHPLKVLVDGGAPFTAPNGDHGRYSYSNGITLLAPPTAPHGASTPSVL